MKMCFFTPSYWDKELYQRFQGFRMRLLETAESLCAVIKEHRN